MDRHCGIISSPESLERSYNHAGMDVTNTRNDIKLVLKWLKSVKFPNVFFYKDIEMTLNEGRLLSVGDFKSGIRFAFQAFDPTRNTRSPETEKMVLLYYTGHGLSEAGASKLNGANGMSSSPRLEKVGYSDPEGRFSTAQPLAPNRKVKGGELCLHEVGFCDLEGLLQPWIAAVKEISTNGTKYNKHLVIIADSCYSGKLVDDLAKMKDRPGPWNENDCSVTVQSASRSDEGTFGGYFTPCFVYYNQNQEELDRLIGEWNDNPKLHHACRGIRLPSPQLETTTERPLENADNGPVLKISFQGFRLRLFRDPGFFKFCHLKYSRALERLRELNEETVNRHLENVGVSHRLKERSDWMNEYLKEVASEK